jgi:hypothetical protein
MISDKDITKLKNVFATKDELLEVKVDVAVLKTDVAELKLDMADVKYGLGRVLVAVDSLIDKFDDLKIETLAYNQILFRHDHQIRELAHKTHVTLSEPG